MQSLLLLAAAATAVWAWKAGHLKALRYGDVAAVIAALIAFRMATKGEMALGLAGLAGAGAWLWFRTKGRTAAPIQTTGAMPLDEARALLDVRAGADRPAIQEAHRRLIARVHPDAGGSAELARRVNAARDTLLAELNHHSPRAS